jgi:hypothetical protein
VLCDMHHIAIPWGKSNRVCKHLLRSAMGATLATAARIRIRIDGIHGDRVIACCCGGEHHGFESSVSDLAFAMKDH